MNEGITTAAMDMLGKLLGGEETVDSLRFPEIMSDAAYVIMTRDSKTFTRNFCIDEDILKEVGVTDFDKYAVKPGACTRTCTLWTIDLNDEFE